MQDKELYQVILGLSTPWSVAAVALNVEAQEIVVEVEHPRGTKFCCPECTLELPCYDLGEQRRWRHLDSCQFKTILSAKVPRVQCPEHGVKSVSVPWAEPNSRFTMLFERLAIDVLMATQTVKGAMGLLRLKWDATWHIIEKAVARGKARKEPSPLPKIGIDEKAFAKGHSYVSMIYDLENSTVEAISDGNDTEAGIACFSQLSEEQVQSVQAVAMDMSASYQQQDYVDQKTRGRLPKSRELQISDLLLLRWTRPLPTVIPDGPNCWALLHFLGRPRIHKHHCQTDRTRTSLPLSRIAPAKATFGW